MERRFENLCGWDLQLRELEGPTGLSVKPLFCRQLTIVTIVAHGTSWPIDVGLIPPWRHVNSSVLASPPSRARTQKWRGRGHPARLFLFVLYPNRSKMPALRPYDLVCGESVFNILRPSFTILLVVCMTWEIEFWFQYIDWTMKTRKLLIIYLLSQILVCDLNYT